MTTVYKSFSRKYLENCLAYPSILLTLLNTDISNYQFARELAITQYQNFKNKLVEHLNPQAQPFSCYSRLLFHHTPSSFSTLAVPPLGDHPNS